MTTLAEIRAFPTSLERAHALAADPTCSGWHESVLRSYHILAKVEELLAADCPSSVILEIIADLKR